MIPLEDFEGEGDDSSSVQDLIMLGIKEIHLASKSQSSLSRLGLEQQALIRCWKDKGVQVD